MTTNSLASLDELKLRHFKIKADLEAKFKAGEFSSKAVFLVCHKGAVSDLYQLDVLAKKAKAQFNIELIPFAKGLTVKVRNSSAANAPK